jgi:hypothetical protein
MVRYLFCEPAEGEDRRQQAPIRGCVTNLQPFITINKLRRKKTVFCSYNPWRRIAVCYQPKHPTQCCCRAGQFVCSSNLSKISAQAPLYDILVSSGRFDGKYRYRYLIIILNLTSLIRNNFFWNKVTFYINLFGAGATTKIPVPASEKLQHQRFRLCNTNVPN